MPGKTAYALVVVGLALVLALLGIFYNPAYAATRDDAKQYQKFSREGLNQYRIKDYAAARKCFAKAAAHMPEEPSVHYYLGMSSFHTRDFETAKNELSKVIVMSKPDSRFYKNAVKCFADYKKEFSRVRPYTCALPTGTTKYFRWSKDRMPLKVFISHGLKLPKGFRGSALNESKKSSLSRWLSDKAYVAKIRRDAIMMIASGKQPVQG